MDDYKYLASRKLNRPYFGPRCASRQGNPTRHRYMSALVASWAKAHSSESCDVLEIGSWTGGSAITWAKALDDAGVEGKVVCVDKWEVRFEATSNVDEVYREMTRAALSGEAESLFWHNVRAAGVEKRILLLRGLSQEVLPLLEPRHFSVVFVDGSHIYEDVLHDLRSAVVLVQDGGVVCGDDLDLQRDECGEKGLQTGIALHTDYQLDQRTGQWYHPGVTAAVAEIFGPVSVWEGFWATQRAGDAWRGVELNGVEDEPPAHLRSTTEVVPALIAENINGHNIIQVDDAYIGIPSSIGPLRVDDDTSLLVAMEATIVGTSLDAVNQEIVALPGNEPAANRRSAPHSLTDPPVLVVEGYRGFNLVAYRRQYYALDQRLGPVQLDGPDFAAFAARGLAAIADSEPAARRIVDELAARAADGAHLSEPTAGSSSEAMLLHVTAEFAADMRNISAAAAAMAAAVTAISASISSFGREEARIAKLDREVVELTLALAEALEARDGMKNELASTIEEYNRTVAAHGCRETELVAAQQQIAELSTTVGTLKAAVSDATNKTMAAELALSRMNADLAAFRASALTERDTHVRELNAARRRISDLKRRVQSSDDARHVLEAEGKELYSWIQRLQREFIAGARSS